MTSLDIPNISLGIILEEHLAMLNHHLPDTHFVWVEVSAELSSVHLARLAVSLIEDILATMSKSSWLRVF